MNCYSRYTEKQADIKAAKTLCKKGKRCIVEQYLKDLEYACYTQGTVTNERFFYSLRYQIAYIRQVLDTSKK